MVLLALGSAGAEEGGDLLLQGEQGGVQVQGRGVRNMKSGLLLEVFLLLLLELKVSCYGLALMHLL